MVFDYFHEKIFSNLIIDEIWFLVKFDEIFSKSIIFRRKLFSSTVQDECTIHLCYYISFLWKIFLSLQIALAFMMSVLVKKPFLTGLMVFLLTVFWGSLGFTALYGHLPAFWEWMLCLLSPFAFTSGMAQVSVNVTISLLHHIKKSSLSNLHNSKQQNPYLCL